MGKRVLRFYNNGSVENIIKFLENVQKKVNFVNLSATVDGCKIVKITLYATRDLQYLAVEKLRNLADEFLQEN